jgi:hypothetical protein
MDGPAQFVVWMRRRVGVSGTTIALAKGKTGVAKKARAAKEGPQIPKQGWYKRPHAGFAAICQAAGSRVECAYIRMYYIQLVQYIHT